MDPSNLCFKPLTDANFVFPHADYGRSMRNKANVNDLQRLAQVPIPPIVPWICKGGVGRRWRGSSLVTKSAADLLHKLNTGLGRAVADNIVIDEALTEIKRRK